MKPTLLTLLLFVCFTLGVHAAFQDRFAVILIDPETERQLGEFPLDRKIIAQALNHLADMQAKGVVIKFFFDLTKDTNADASLAQAMSRLPTILEARILDPEPHPNPFPDRFFLANLTPDRVQTFSGQSGWIPMPIFAAQAHAIGFVDLPDNGNMPIIEKYQGKIVPSLLLCSLELSFGSKAQIIPGKSFTLAGRSIALDSENNIPIHFPSRDQLEYLKFHDLLAGKIPPEQIKGKVIILGYDGPKIQKLPSPLGPLGAHRFFIYSLQDISNRLDSTR